MRKKEEKSKNVWFQKNSTGSSKFTESPVAKQLFSNAIESHEVNFWLTQGKQLHN